MTLPLPQPENPTHAEKSAARPREVATFAEDVPSAALNIYVLYVAGASGDFNAEYVGGQVLLVQMFNSKNVDLLSTLVISCDSNWQRANRPRLF